MQNRPVWIAFLSVCFLITGLAGLFASYASSTPLERAIHRVRVLDQALAIGGEPEALRKLLGADAELVLRADGNLADRVTVARHVAMAEGEREARATGGRSRLLLGVVTMLAGGLGAGILLIAAKGTPPRPRVGQESA